MLYRMSTKAQKQRLERLAQFIKERRQELGLDQGGLKSRGGPSIVTVGKLERADTPDPQPSTLDRLDVSLGWERGSSAAVLAGRIDRPNVQQSSPDVHWLRPVPDENPTIAAIEADPHLLPEAKAHFLNQYELLLRVQSVERLPYVARGQRTGPVDPEQEAAIDAAVLAAASKNPHSPKRSK